eukprot:Em0007g526a
MDIQFLFCKTNKLWQSLTREHGSTQTSLSIFLLHPQVWHLLQPKWLLNTASLWRAGNRSETYLVGALMEATLSSDQTKPSEYIIDHSTVFHQSP